MKKFLLYFSVFFMIGTILTIIGLTILDDYIYAINNSSSIITAVPADIKTDVIAKANTMTLDTNATLLDFTYDNKYMTYLKDNKIYISKIENGENSDTISEDNPIVYYKLLYDKNIIMYFTEQKTANYSKITLHTYDIAQKRKEDYSKINVYNFSKIKDIELSPIINIIYVDLEIKTGNYTYSNIYKIDLFNNISLFTSEIHINKMLMMQNKDRLYYQDANNNIYYSVYASWNKLNIFKDKVSIIGIDLEDNLYFLNDKTKKEVYKVANNQITETISLTDTDLVTTYCNNSGVYLVYPKYVIDVASSNIYARIGRLSKFVSFEAIKDNMMYVKTNDNTIVQLETIKN